MGEGCCHEGSLTGAMQSAASSAAGDVSGTIEAVGAEEREAIRMEEEENWWRVRQGDTLWRLSQKHLGDPALWPCLQSACRRELGCRDPRFLRPGTRLTDRCVERARIRAERQKGPWWWFWRWFG